MKKTQVIYKLDGIDADDGVDVFEITPILMHFGELIRSASNVLEYGQKIDVKIKPFRSGSWITDFLIQQNPIEGLLHFLNTEEGKNLLNMLALLGIGAKDGVVGLAHVVRFTKGNVNNFIKTKDKNTVTYNSPTGETLEVTMDAHRLVQSPVIQNNYYNCTVVPFEKFPQTESVSFEVSNSQDLQKEIYTKDDIDSIERYAATELLEDIEDNINILPNVFLKPKRGSYSGEEKQYSFIMGDGNVLWPVTIDDVDFREKMIAGEIRLYAEDVLKVDLKVKQKKDIKNKITVGYSIETVHDYIKYEKPKQLKISDI